MKWLSFSLLLFIGLQLKAQINYSGTYSGKINGDFTQIEMNQSASTVSGKYIETGNTYDLKAQVVSGKLVGELFISGATIPLATFEATKTGSGIQMDLLLLGVTRVSGDFVLSTNAQANAASNATNASKTTNNLSPKPPKDNLERDPAVFGNWIKEEVINSGFGDQGASLVTAYYLSFLPDGTFVQEVASGSGGSNWSMADSRKPDAAGHWYTKDQIMYVRPTGQKDYTRLNRYLFHEGALVFKTEAGKYLIWNRR